MTTDSPLSTAEQALDKECYDASQPKRDAMDLRTTPAYTLNAPYAVAKALQTVGVVLPFRPRLAKLPEEEFDIANYDLLEPHARGMRHADLQVARYVKRLSEIPELMGEASETRSILLDYASVVSRKGGIKPEVIKAVQEGNGALDTAKDLNVLVKELTDAPAGTIGEATPVTFADLDRATTLAHEIQLHVGSGGQNTDYRALLGERQKQAALLVRAQDQVRRGMSFLRWDEKDAAKFVPSLYVTGTKAPKTSDDEVPAEVVAMHEQLHQVAPESVDPEDNPFAPEE